MKDIKANSWENFVAWRLRKYLIMDNSKINEDFEYIFLYTQIVVQHLILSMMCISFQML